jgi:hypothetical protein
VNKDGPGFNKTTALEVLAFKQSFVITVVALSATRMASSPSSSSSSSSRNEQH